MRPLLSSKLFLVFCFLFHLCNMAYAVSSMPRKLALYTVSRTECPPNSNNTLNEECWDDVPASTVYYEYWKADPEISSLKTEMRLLYNKSGVYMKLINFDDNMENIRAAIVRRDDPSLWKDDCAEIYFDPQANGVGYTVFTMNSTGIQGDRRQLDAAVNLEEWRGNEWRVTTKKNEDSWVIEAFFPWSDLGKQAKSGDVWMFNHVRYAWSSGKFVGSTWSPGGSYQNPGRFGFLYFKGGEEPSIEVVSEVLKKTAAPPWMLSFDDKVLLHELPQETRVTNIKELASTQLIELQDLLDKINNLNPQKPRNKQAESLNNQTLEFSKNDTPITFDEVDKIAALKKQAEELYWELKLEQLLQNVKALS